MKPVVKYSVYLDILLRVSIYVTKCCFFNEHNANHKIYQIAIRWPDETDISRNDWHHTQGTRLECYAPGALVAPLLQHGSAWPFEVAYISPMGDPGSFI